MIRLATEGDFDGILENCAEFWNETMFDEHFDANHCLTMVELAHSHGLLAVLDCGHIAGFSAGIMSPSMGSPLAIVGTELAWWIKPDYRRGRNGIALLNFMEQLAREKGVKYWTMAAMMSSMPEIVCSMYEKMGYHKSEICYTKVL